PGCAIWPVWAAPGQRRPAEPGPAGRPLRAVAPAPMLRASPPARRRAPERPAHAPVQTISWHQPSSELKRGRRVGYISPSVQQVLVLNASYEPLNVCSLRRAHVLVFKGKAEVIEELDRPLCSATATYPWPHVIRLVQYVRVPRAVQRKISRRALFARDGWRCVYCCSSGGCLRLDRVGPRARGGVSVWVEVGSSG